MQLDKGLKVKGLGKYNLILDNFQIIEKGNSKLIRSPKKKIANLVNEKGRRPWDYCLKKFRIVILG